MSKEIDFTDEDRAIMENINKDLCNIKGNLDSIGDSLGSTSKHLNNSKRSISSIFVACGLMIACGFWLCYLLVTLP